MTSPAGDASVRTYRYLRIGIVALVVLLGASVLHEIVRGVGLLGSISEYHYSPARSIFVGVLFATGLSLVAIKGRGVEDALLNGAGILAPIVAVVPMPLEADTGRYRFPAGTSDAVRNNVLALAFVALIGLGFAAWTAARVTRRERGPAWKGLAAATALVLAFAVWFAVDDASFEQAAHFVAAVGLFGVFVVVAWINARETPARTCRMAMLTAERRVAAYRVISVGMGAVSVVAVAFGVLELTDHRPFDHWLFVVEALLLALFSAFWLLQTAEFWDEGA